MPIISFNHLKISFLLLGLFYTGFAQASDASLTQIEIPELSGTIKVDGVLDEALWSKAKKIQLRIETRPAENEPAPVDTEAFIFSTEDTLYVGFNAHDPRPEEIRAYYQERDTIYDNDFLGIRIDPYDDETWIYEFFSNPLGVQSEILSNVASGSGGFGNVSWNAIWDSEGQITDDGYRVEMAIPLRVINFNATLDRQKWGIEIIRYYPREVTHRLSIAPKDRNRNCDACQLTPASGLASAKQGHSLNIVPGLVYGVGQQRDIETQDADWETDSNAELSLDVQWGITPDDNLNLTLNPDFSQIEADAAQLSINNSFALFFPEKRAFFLDNADFYNTNFRLLHTRNIANPDYGIKYSGRHNNHAYGFFVANDEQTSYLIPGNIRSGIATLESSSEAAVARYRYTPSKELSLGWLGTFRRATDYHNSVQSLDARYRPTEQDNFIAQIVLTDTQNPEGLFNDFCDGDDCSQAPREPCTQGLCEFNEQVLRTQRTDSYKGLGYSFSYRHSTRDWNSFVSYRLKDRNFRADLGFVNQIDYNKFGFGGAYNWYQNGDHWWQKITLYSDWDITHNDENELLEKEIQLSINLEGKKQFNARLQIESRDVVGNRTDPSLLQIDNNAPLFQETGLIFDFDIQATPSIKTSLFTYYGDRVDRANNQPGTLTQLVPQISWKANRHARLQAKHTWNKLDVDQGSLFTANLTDLRATWQFDVRSFIRLSLIYSDIKRDPALYLFDDVEKRSQSRSSQLLYSYKINPQTVFFLGYSDSGFAAEELNSIQTDQRTLFMKLSYAWLR
ncbi:MAG: DUF5916 domain-containing protein [bacterium]